MRIPHYMDRKKNKRHHASKEYCMTCLSLLFFFLFGFLDIVYVTNTEISTDTFLWRNMWKQRKLERTGTTLGKYRQKMKMSAIPKALLNLFCKNNLKSFFKGTVHIFSVILKFCCMSFYYRTQFIPGSDSGKKQENLCNSAAHWMQELLHLIPHLA